MSDSTALIPADVKLAAKRGFLRTTYQAYATALTLGISVTTVLGLYNGEIDLVPTLITGAITMLSPLLAGAAAYFSIASKGIPEEYAPLTTRTGQVLTVDGVAVDPEPPEGTGTHRAE